MLRNHSLMKKITAAVIIAVVTHAVNKWVDSDE